MTSSELKKHYRLKLDEIRLEKKINELIKKSAQYNRKDYTEQIKQLTKEYYEKSIRCLEDEIRLYKEIMDIPDSKTRIILKCHFLQAQSFYQIALFIDSTEMAVKRHCDRYLAKLDKGQI